MPLPDLLANFALNPATLLLLVFGLVEYAKSFGLQGARLRLLSMALGALLAVAYRLASLYPLVAPWVELLFYGLLVGVAASGVYDFLNARFPQIGPATLRPYTPPGTPQAGADGSGARALREHDDGPA